MNDSRIQVGGLGGQGSGNLVANSETRFSGNGASSAHGAVPASVESKPRFVQGLALLDPRSALGTAANVVACCIGIRLDLSLARE